MLVVIPVALHEIDRAKDLLAWIAELDHFLPNHRYLIVASSRVPSEDAFELTALANRVFPVGYAIKQREVVETGWPRSSNAMFQLAAKWVSENGAGNFLWLESDSIPTRTGWLDEIESEYRRVSKPFMGTLYDHPFKHFNGVMVYPYDLQSKHPYMLAATAKPWDCVRPDVVMRQGHNTPLIQRLLADPSTNTPMTFPDRNSLSVIRPECAIFHGCKDGTLISRLRESNKVIAIPPKRHAVPKLLKKTKLTVVMSFCNKDANVARATLEWILELNGGQRHDNPIVLSYDTTTFPDLVEGVKSAAKLAFKSVGVTIYDPPQPKQLPQTMAFKHAAEFMASRFLKRSWIWYEPDMVALRPEWLDVLQDEYLKCGQPFMGPIVSGKGHCNGTAIYPANAAEYICDALKMTWTAWDTAMRHEMLPYCHNASHLMQHVWGVVNGRFHPFGGLAPSFNDTALLSQIDPRAVIFHRCKDLSLQDAIRTHGLPPRKESKVIVKEKASSVEIMIVSYHKDVEWLRYCLASVEKFSTGFSGVTILVPTADRSVFSWIAELYPDMLLLDYQPPANPKLWHVAHQLQKMRADEWCPGADFILHIDSDCVFTEPVSPKDYFVNGKPVLWIEEFALTKGPWKAVTERALGMSVKYDTMRRHPAVHYRALYGTARDIVSKAHNKPFDDYVMSCPVVNRKVTDSWGISEFEVLGNVALTPDWKDRYYLFDLGHFKRPTEKLLQCWSLSPPDREQPLPSIGGRAVPLEVFRKLGLEEKVMA